MYEEQKTTYSYSFADCSKVFKICNNVESSGHIPDTNVKKIPAGAVLALSANEEGFIFFQPMLDEIFVIENTEFGILLDDVVFDSDEKSYKEGRIVVCGNFHVENLFRYERAGFEPREGLEKTLIEFTSWQKHRAVLV